MVIRGGGGVRDALGVVAASTGRKRLSLVDFLNTGVPVELQEAARHEKFDADVFPTARQAELFQSFPHGEDCTSVAADPAPGRGGDPRGGMALVESLGFFDESDEVWARRRQRHVNQMCLQGQLMSSCPGRIWHKECHPGCAPFPAVEGCRPRSFWQAHYEPSFSCGFERRIGFQGEGGKWICDPHKIQMGVATGRPCLVYSVGSAGRFDFEAAVHGSISPHCEIHTFDEHHWSHYNLRREKKGKPLEFPPAYVHYHVYRVGLPSRSSNATPMSAIVKDLGHERRTIDIFKIDCERCEWESFPSWFAHDVHIRQIQVELHGRDWRQHLFFKALFDMGYVVFHKEPNIYGTGGDCQEYAFLKLAPEFSRALAA